MSRPATSFEDALAICLDDLSRGASPAECLARFPEHAAELAPLLQVAARTQAQPLPALSLRGRVRGRERMHAALAQPVAGPGWVRAWAGGVAGLAFLLVLAAGIWLSWPGRNDRVGGQPTVQPMTPFTTPSATPTPTLTAPGSPTPTASPTLLVEPATVTPTSTPTPSPTVSATPTPGPTASPAGTPTRRVIPTDAPPATEAAPTASPTLRPAATATQRPAETPQARPTTEPTETDPRADHVYPAAAAHRHAQPAAECHTCASHRGAHAPAHRKAGEVTDAWTGSCSHSHAR